MFRTHKGVRKIKASYSNHQVQYGLVRTADMVITSLVTIIYQFTSVWASVLHDTELFIKISTKLFNILILQIILLMLLQELISNLYLR